jgi:Putative transposase
LLNVHAHVLALDGVYVREDDDGPLVFHALPTPTHAEVAEVARRTAERIEHILRAHGRSLDPTMQDDAPTSLAVDEAGLAACYAAAARGISVAGSRAGQPTLRLVSLKDAPAHPGYDSGAGAAESEEPVAEVRGVNVHAKQRIDGRDRRRLERVCRYITRPPVAQERLALRADGRIELTLKSIWRDGTRALVFEPHDVLTRLVAAVPPPGFHMLRYFGLLSSHAVLRNEVVPNPPKDRSQSRPPPAQGEQLCLLDDDAQEPPASRKPWAWLLKHVFQADLQTCPRCSGPMRWMEAATTPGAIARLLAKHGLAPQPPPTRAAVPTGQLALPFHP